MEIYEPSDDSYFFEEFLDQYLKENKIKSYLDIGTGSGILPKTALKYLDKKNILAADINSNAVKLAKSNGINAKVSDLFENIKQKFDLITFNAPYLPLDKREPKESRLATTGGKNGDEVSIKFLNQAINHLNKGGRIFLLISSLTPTARIKKFKGRVTARKKLFQEELIILEFSL